MEQEIDLRKYIDTILHWWWLAAVLAMLCGIVVLVYSLLIPDLYTARAGLLYLPTRASISLGSEFMSSTGDDLPTGSSSAVVNDSLTRRYASMVNMVKSLEIAKEVKTILGDDLPEEIRSARALLEIVNGSVANVGGIGESDTIQIMVTYTDPVLAARIANAWAVLYEDYVNAIYGDASYSPFADIDAELIAARDAYDKAQETLVVFMREEDISSELSRHIEEDLGVIRSLYTGRQLSYMDVITAQNTAQHAMFNYSVIAATNANLKMYNEHWNDFIDEYNRAYDRRRRYINALEDLEIMRTQLLAGGESSAATNGMALQAIKARIANIDSVFWLGTIDVQIDSMSDLYGDQTVEQQLADLEAIVDSVEAEITRLDTAIEDIETLIFQGDMNTFMETLSPESLDKTAASATDALLRMQEWNGLLQYSDVLEVPYTSEIARLEDRVRENKAEFEALNGRYNILEQERNLALATYRNLVSKQQEVKVAAATGSSDLLFVVEAVPPVNPSSPGGLTRSVIAAVSGALVGVIGGFLLDYLNFDSTPSVFWRQLWKKEPRSA